MAGEIRQKIRNLSTQSVHPRPLITTTHKSNVLFQPDGLIRETARAALAEPQYSHLAVEEQIFDSMVYIFFAGFLTSSVSRKGGRKRVPQYEAQYEEKGR